MRRWHRGQHDGSRADRMPAGLRSLHRRGDRTAWRPALRSRRGGAMTKVGFQLRHNVQQPKREQEAVMPTDYHYAWAGQGNKHRRATSIQEGGGHAAPSGTVRLMVKAVERDDLSDPEGKRKITPVIYQ